MGVIFDLDQTLIDSREVEKYRNSRKWGKVYEIIPRIRPYDGISELLNVLNKLKVPICIVTSSPRPYCEKIISFFGWVIDATVCYHDTEQHKPYPQPILLGLSRIGIKRDIALSVGDDTKDIQASRAANVYSVGALWGTTDRESLIRSNPNILFENISQFQQFLIHRFTS